LINKELKNICIDMANYQRSKVYPIVKTRNHDF